MSSVASASSSGHGVVGLANVPLEAGWDLVRDEQLLSAEDPERLARLQAREFAGGGVGEAEAFARDARLARWLVSEDHHVRVGDQVVGELADARSGMAGAGSIPRSAVPGATAQ